MNKESLIIKLLEMLLNNESAPEKERKDAVNDLVGKPVIIRCRDAGVHFGYYVSHSGREVVISRSRRMWLWWAKKQMTLSAVAEFGLNEGKDLRIQCEMSGDVHLLEACEILPCTQECVESFGRVVPYDEQ